MRYLFCTLLMLSIISISIEASPIYSANNFFSQDSIKKDSVRIYFNAGLITSFIIPEDCTRPDIGGSVRVGILTKGRLGYFGGYSWFYEYHEDFIEYDDRGRLFMAGLNYRLLEYKKLQCYASLGLMIEYFISDYSNRTETEVSLKPDFGILFNMVNFNAYLGWQPSAPSHYIIGVGYTVRLE